MFVMKRIKRCEIGPNVDQNAIKAYNKNACWVQSAARMGDQWIEKEMEMVNEKV